MLHILSKNFGPYLNDPTDDTGGSGSQTKETVDKEGETTKEE